MHPVTHLLAGWMVANAADLSNRDRLVVTLAGVARDVDGIGVALEFATRSLLGTVFRCLAVDLVGSVAAQLVAEQPDHDASLGCDSLPGVAARVLASRHPSTACRPRHRENASRALRRAGRFGLTSSL